MLKVREVEYLELVFDKHSDVMMLFVLKRFSFSPYKEQSCINMPLRSYSFSGNDQIEIYWYFNLSEIADVNSPLIAVLTINSPVCVCWAKGQSNPLYL